MSREYDKLIDDLFRENNQKIDEYTLGVYRLLEGENLDEVTFYKLLSEYDDISLIKDLIGIICYPNVPSRDKSKCIDKLNENGINVIKYTTKEIIIEFRNKIITFQNLCSNFKEFKKSDYNANNRIYDKEVYIPILIERIKKLKYKAKLVIGHVTHSINSVKEILAWIEIVKNEKSYVINFTNNTVMNKETFYMFYNPKVLNEIEKEEIPSDEFLSILVNDLSIRYGEYLMFSEEFNKDIEKNKRLFLK